MTANPTMPLDDVLYAFAMATPIPDPGTLEEFTRKYPAYADDLTDFAVDLLLDSAIEDEADEADDDDSVSPAVSRAISHFQNALYELEKKPVPALQTVPQTKNPFADMDRTRFRSVARGLNANNTFLIKLRDRTIEPETVTSRIGFCEKVAREAGEPMYLVIAHFQGPPVLARGQHFKSDAKPALSARETFEEAVRNSGLSPEQQCYLLKL